MTITDIATDSHPTPTLSLLHLPATVHARHAMADAQRRADYNCTPCVVWTRDGWYSVCEEPPDDMDPSPYDTGWTVYAIVEPREVLS